MQRLLLRATEAAEMLGVSRWLFTNLPQRRLFLQFGSASRCAFLSDI